MTECQLIKLWLTHCHRGQAPSHIKVSVFDRLRVAFGFFLQDFGPCMNFSGATEQMWEEACPR